MNTTIWAGALLTLLGVGGVAITGATTAAIPAIFGLIMLGLGALQNNPARAKAAGWAAGGVALLGLLAPLGNLARVLGSASFTLNAASIANISMAIICGLYLALWARDRWGARQGRAAR